MITIEEYLKNPCRKLSIPFWKYNTMKLPENIRVIHDNEFNNEIDYNRKDIFKRLIHNLENIEKNMVSNFIIRNVNIKNDLDIIVDIINKSYEYISVTKEQMLSYTNTDVYDEDLWILVYEDDNPIGLGIGDFDSELNEGILEWIQVLPEYRNNGVGKIIVNELLYRLSKKADFVTVSFDDNNSTKPEYLYRSCGFTGNDIFHILYKKRLI